MLRQHRREGLRSRSRKLEVTAAAMAKWRDQFLGREQGTLRSRLTEERGEQSERIKAKIPEITMENEVLRERAGRVDANHPSLNAEAEAMGHRSSCSAVRPYLLAFTYRVLELSWSSMYAARAPAQATAACPGTRGSNSAWSDPALIAAVDAVLASPLCLGEGYRKAWIRLHQAEFCPSRAPVLRLMPEANQLAPTRAGRSRCPPTHDGTGIALTAQVAA